MNPGEYIRDRQPGPLSYARPQSSPHTRLRQHVGSVITRRNGQRLADAVASQLSRLPTRSLSQNKPFACACAAQIKVRGGSRTLFPPHLSSSSVPTPSRPRRPPPSPPSMALPTMTHSSAFLLPAGSNKPADAGATTYALIVLNQRLPRFAPLLWARGDASISLFPTASSLPFAPLFAGSPIGFPCFFSLWCVLICCLEQRGCGCARTVAPIASSTACRSCSPTRTRPRSARGGYANLNVLSLIIAYACLCLTKCLPSV